MRNNVLTIALSKILLIIVLKAKSVTTIQSNISIFSNM